MTMPVKTVRVAVLGLGAMGEPMAANLLKKGFTVSVLAHRRREAADRLAALGAHVQGELAAAVKDADAVLLMLPGSAEVEAVALGAQGLEALLARNALVIDGSTSDPRSTRRVHAALAQRGIAMVDAPVTRGVVGARDAKLAYFIGGEAPDVERALPVLQAMGDTFIRMGGPGAGHQAKVLVQSLSYGTVALIAEILAIGERAGLPHPALIEALQAGAGSKALDAFGARLLARDVQAPRVRVRDALSHLRLLSHMNGAADAVLSASVGEQLDALAQEGHGMHDIAALSTRWPAP